MSELCSESQNETIRHLGALRSLAELKNKHYQPCNYKWVLGVEVINDIVNELYFHRGIDMPMSLFGIPVQRDYENPKNIELWQNITNEL